MKTKPVLLIAHSQNKFGNGIATFQCEVDSETLKTLFKHKEFSVTIQEKSFDDVLKQVQEKPFIPVVWKKTKGKEYIQDNEAILKRCGVNSPESLEHVWLIARDNAVKIANELSEGIKVNTSMFDTLKYQEDTQVDKQTCYHLLLPFVRYTVIITATEWERFFTLRCPIYEGRKNREYCDGMTDFVKYKSKRDYLISGFHNSKDDGSIDWLVKNENQSEIHLMNLAEEMWDLLNKSKPKILEAEGWHIPFAPNINDADDTKTSNLVKAIVATARIATGVISDDYESAIKKHNKLLQSDDLSMFEHCAKVMDKSCFMSFMKVVRLNSHLLTEEQGWSDNFRWFIPYSKFL